MVSTIGSLRECSWPSGSLDVMYVYPFWYKLVWIGKCQNILSWLAFNFTKHSPNTHQTLYKGGTTYLNIKMQLDQAPNGMFVGKSKLTKICPHEGHLQALAAPKDFRPHLENPRGWQAVSPPFSWLGWVIDFVQKGRQRGILDLSDCRLLALQYLDPAILPDSTKHNLLSSRTLKSW